MKAYATILIFFFMTFWFSNSLGSVGLSPVIQTGATEGHSYAELSGSMIRILNPQNQSATVLLDSQLNLTWMTVGSSTIVNPPIETRSKLDANLLNLTELLTEGYLDNNQTNVILSLSDRNAPEKPEDNENFSNLIVNAHTIYTSENAHSQMNFLAGRLNYTTIFKLAENPQVAHIWLDRNFHVCLDQSVPLIKNPQQWAQIESSFGRSINGTGIKIAILDTGIDSTHPDFTFPNGTSRIVGAISYVPEESASDGYGHGTHCASIAAGTGAASSYEYVGVAPGASLLNVKVLDNTGQGQEGWIISGIQWAVDNEANILSMSFGTNVDGDGSDPLSTVVNWAVSQGSVCVVAAGNSGPQMYTLGSPGVAGLAITVGASTKSDVIADFSSNGPTSDYRIKPDVVAPGVDIVAARASGTSMGTPVSDYYTMASGTSMATPHVAGAVALLLDAHPSWNPMIVKTALSNYAQDIGANVLAQGSGRIDVCQAVNASIVGNSSLSFGKVHLNTAYSCVVTLQNLASRTVNLALNSYAWSISDGTPYDVTSLNTSSLTLASGATGNVRLTLTANGALQDGYYEGKVTATFNGASIRIPIFFCILSQLNVQVTDEKGSALMSSFVLINAQTTAIQAISECPSAEFTVPPGDYIVQAMDIYGLNPALGTMDTSFSFLIYEEVSLGTDQTINLQLSLSSTHKLSVRSTDVGNTPLHLVHKMLYTLYYGMGYLSDTLGQYASQYLYLTDVSDYLKGPCFFGFAGFPQDYSSWNQTGTLASDVNMYFIGWDLSTFGPSNMPAALTYTNSELATFNIDTMLPESSPASIIWFNQIAGMWQSGFWYGYQTHPGILWKTHILPYQYRTSPSANWSQLEWSCMYTFSTNFGSAEDYVIDRHFQPITKGENSSYSIGKTPLLPQDVVQDPPDVGSGLYVPYYPLRIEKNLFIDKTGTQATKRLEVFKNGNLIDNETKTWSGPYAPIPISQFLNSYGLGLYTFVVKTQTSFNYSSQNIAEYTINYTSTSTDLIPPSITKVDCEPCFTKNDHPVEIQLADNDRISSVSLNYSTDNGPYLPASLTNLGNNCFSADLTLPTGAQKLSLIVEASDGNGNKVRFTTAPAATRGYETSIYASLNGATITGKLTVIGGSLLQPVYLKVKSNGQIMYTLTNANGNFAFNLPPSIGFRIDIEMSPLGPYDGSSWVINFLNVQTEPAGIVSIPGGGWYIQATDTVLTAPGSLNASSNTRYRFSYWDVDGTSQGSGVNPITVHMDANHTATAHYVTQYTLLFTQTGLSSDATGIVATVNGNSKSFSDFPLTLWVDSGSSVTYSYSDVVLSIAVGKRQKQVSVTGPASPITVSDPVTIAGNYKTQYYLTVSTDPTAITTIPGEGWYDASAHETLTAPQVNNYQFNHWDVDGASQGTQVNPITASMNAAHSVTAHYTPTTPTNIVITNVTSPKKIVGQGLPTPIIVTVTNQGNHSETFNVTAYANTTTMASQNITLPTGNSTSVTFTWNTTGFAKGNYSLSAYAWPVLGETSLLDNNFTDGTVLVTIPGDINGDQYVNAKDAVILGGAFYPAGAYDPNADINDDGYVNAKDAVILGMCFGDSWI